MNKKKILGMPVAVLVLGGASAILVDYLSNTVTATANVQSPIELKIAENYGTWNNDQVDLGNVSAGDSVTFYIREEVFSDNNVSSILKIVINNSLGVTNCSEIPSLMVEGNYNTNASYDIEDLCVHDNVTDELVYNVPSDNMTTGVRTYNITPTFAVNAYGNYTATARHVPIV